MNEAKLKMNNSPHQLSKFSTKKIMRDVIISMIPALIAGVIFFGIYALMIVCITILSCVVSEIIYNKVRKKPLTVKDLSAVVTGLILGLNLPPNSPIYIPIIGGVFAIIIVKMLFGGLGKNFANPAATARVFLLLGYATMTRYIVPSLISGNYTGFGDLITGSTYLSGGINATTLQTQFLGFTGLKALNLQLFLGATGGCIGETSALAILIGFIYLTVRKVIDIRIPFAVVLSSAFFAFVFTGNINNVLPQILSGGLLFGAVFMATDYATSPMTVSSKLFFGFGIGLITMLIRFYGSYPEGMSLAIVFMNLLVPLMDRYILPVRFGENRKAIAPMVSICLVLVMCVILIISGFITKDKQYNDSISNDINECSIYGGDLL